MSSFGPRAPGPILGGSMLPHLNLTTGPETMGENHMTFDENLSNLKNDELISRIHQLTTENTQLKATIHQTNTSMKKACDSFAALKEKAQKDEEQHYQQSKNVVLDLRKKIGDKDRIIEKLKQQITQDAASLDDSSDLKQLQSENDRLMQENQMLKNKMAELQSVSSEEIKTLKLQVANLVSNQDMKQQFLQERTMLNQRCLALEKVVENLQSEKSNLIVELDKQSNELRSVSKNYEQLMCDYHDLLTSNDQQKSTQDSQVAGIKKEFESRLDNLTAQLVTAEEVLSRKDEQIRTLRQELTDLEPVKAQVAIYKADFEAERQSREELNDRWLQLKEKHQLLEREVHVQRQRVPFQNPTHNPRQQPPVSPVYLPQGPGQMPNLYPGPGSMPNLYQGPRPMANLQQGPGPVNPSVRPNPPMPAETEFKCPICNLISPDLDSLQLHVEECLNRQH